MDFSPEKLLLPIFQEEKSLILLQRQIMKDFASSGIDFPANFSDEVFTLLDLLVLLQDKLIQVMEKGERQTLQLLYTIDVPENKFLSIIEKDHKVENLSHLILEREAQKVYFKLKYS